MHILDLSGKRMKSYKPHLASITDLSMDNTGDFIATASLDGESLNFVEMLSSYTTLRTGRSPFLIHLRVIFLRYETANANYFYRA